MGCATNKQYSNTTIINSNFEIIQDKMLESKQKISFIDDDDESDSSSSCDSIIHHIQTPNNPPPPPSGKRPMNEPLFLNFTSDLSPQKLNKKKTKPKKQNDYRVNGVNILNRNNLDSKTVIERIQRRRENHNHVERRRRDNINNIIFELSNVVPNAIQSGQKPNKGNILKLSLDYIKALQAENRALKERLEIPSNTNLSIPSIPNSPINNNNNNESIYTIPPISLPPPQPFFSNSTSSSNASTPILMNNTTLQSPTSTIYTPSPQSATPTNFYIPQPPTLYNNTNSSNITLLSQIPTNHPSNRMSGYEKIYGNVCRY